MNANFSQRPSPYPVCSGPLLAKIALAAGLGTAAAQTPLYWDPSGTGTSLGGSGTWNTTSSSWVAGSLSAPQAWPSGSTGNGYFAMFDGTGGTVTVSGSVTAQRLMFESDGYTLAVSGANKLTLDNSSGFPAWIFVDHAGDTATIRGSISQTNGVVIGGRGTVALTSANTLGNVLVDGGTLRLAAATGSLASTDSITFGYGLGDVGGGGGTFILDNTGATSAVTQTLSYIFLSGGPATVKLNQGAAQNLTLDIGGLYSGVGTTLNFVINGGTAGVDSFIKVDNQSAGDFLSPTIFFNGSNFAYYDSGGYVRGINYGVDAGSVAVNGGSSVASTQFAMITGDITAQQDASFNGFTLSGSSNLTIASGNTLQAAGILKSGGGASVISGGTLQAASSYTQLTVRTDLASDQLTINSAIVDSLAGSTNLTKVGDGTLVLGGANTYSGGSFLDGGIISVGAMSALGTGSLYFNSGTLQYTGATASATGSFTFGTSGGGIDVAQAGTVFTINSALIGNNAGLLDDAMVKSGAGTLVLSGSDDDSGLDVTVNGGLLILAKSSATFTHAASNVSINNGGTVQLSGTGGDQIYDNGSLYLSAGGLFDMNGLAESLDGLKGTGGSIANNSTTANSTLTVGKGDSESAGTVWDFGGSITDGSGGRTLALVKTGLGTQILSGSNTYTGGTTISQGVLQIGNGGTGGSIVGNVTNSGTLIFNRSDASSYTGVVSSSGALIKQGSGTLTLSGTSSYTGTTTIAAGTLKLGGAGAGTKSPLGATTGGTRVLAGGALDLNGFSLVTAEALSLTGTGNGSGALFNSGAAAAYSGVVTIATGGASIGGSGGITLSSALAANANKLTKVGTGTLALTTNSTRTGAAEVQQGTLSLSSATALGTSAVALTLSGGNLTLANNTSTTFGAYATTLTGDSSVTVDRTATAATSGTHTLGTLSMGAQTLTVNRGTLMTGTSVGGLKFGAVTLTANGATFSPSANASLTLASVGGSGFGFTVTGSGSTLISGAVTTGTGSLTKTGSGALTLSGANTFTGGVTLSGGQITVSSGASLAGATSALIVNSGTLTFSNTAQTVAGLNGTGGVISLGSGHTFTANLAGANDFSGQLTGSGSLVKTGTGSLHLSGSNTYTGGTTISSGTLAAGNNAALGTGTVSVASGAVFLVDAGVTVSNTVSLSGGSYGRSFSAGASLANAVNATSNVGGALPATTASLLAGTSSSATTLQTSFANTSSALNDSIRLSNVYQFQGTNTDVFVLQLSMTSAASGTLLGWIDGNNQWVNAVQGNTGNNATAGQLGFNGSFASFTALYGTDLSAYIGAFGSYTNAGQVITWAVLDHNSSFAVIPEPGTCLLVGVGLSGLLLFRRRQA